MSRLLLAPLEGLADELLRELLTRAASYDECVTAFLRVTGSLLPRRAFFRACPELRTGARTSSGTPLRVQLMGSDARCLADNAARLAQLRPAGIDLNFGCPAPLVNRHGGGAALLATPGRLYEITAAVRAAVPAGLPVSAKMRLGLDDPSAVLECARALAAGGIDRLTVHARTRSDGYRPQVRWEWLARLRETLDVPLVANGGVWSVADWRAIRATSGCADVMLARGAVADPFLAARIRGERGEQPDGADWCELLELIVEYWLRVQEKVAAHHAPGRLKQWLVLLRLRYPGAERMWRALRALGRPEDIARVLAHERGQSAWVRAA